MQTISKPILRSIGNLFKYQEKLRQLAPDEVPSVGFLPVIPVVKAGLAAWTAYQLYATGRDMVHDAKVQESWKKGKYIDTFGYGARHLPVVGDAICGGRSLAQGDYRRAWLWPANALFTLYGGKVIGKGGRWLVNRATLKINRLFGQLGGGKGIMKKGRGNVAKLIPPKVQANINSRHKLSSNAIAKAEKFKDCTCAPPEVLAKDIAAYNAGDFTKIRGNVLINGREYCLKQEGHTLFPVKGDDFVMLRSSQMRAIKLLKTTPPEKLQDALKGINKNAILITDQDLAFAKEFIAKY